MRLKHKNQEKKQACFLVPYKRFHFFFAFLCGSPYYRKWSLRKNTAKKIWTLFSVRQRLGIWMTFCRDEENHCLPTQWPTQQTFGKRWESPLNGEFAEEEEWLVKRLRCWFHIRGRASQRNARLFGFSISRDSPGLSKCRRFVIAFNF